MKTKKNNIGAKIMKNLGLTSIYACDPNPFELFTHMCY